MEPMNPASVVRITFANPVKGVVQLRRVVPFALRWGSLAACCPKAASLGRPDEWLFDAADLDKEGTPTKTFPLECVTHWEPAPQASL